MFPLRLSATHSIAVLLALQPMSTALADISPVASAAAGAAQELAEVRVTARWREESLQSVPVAVSVVSGELLDRTLSVNTQQLAQFTPSLYYNSANPRNTAYTIRGLGSNTLSISAANDGIEPGVGFYVDQVYHARPATAAFDFTDIERVEVLRGPQGTLFGKNTTAGAIHVISREPQFTPAANAEVSAGGFDFLQLRGSVTGALSGDRLAGRLAAQLTRRDGVLRNVRNGAALNALDNTALRGQLLLAPTTTLTLRLTADVAELESACCTQNFLRIGTSLRSASRQFPALAAGLGYAPPSTDVFDRLTDIDSALRIDTRDGGVSLIADWTLPRGTLTSISAWRYWDWDVANDRDFTGVPIQTVQRIPSRQDQWSQELRFASNDAERTRYVVGLFGFAQTIRARPTSVYGSEAAYWLLNPANFAVPIPRDLLDGYSQTGRSRFSMDSYAAFGEVDHRLTEQLTLTLGLRYTHEDKRGGFETTVQGGPALSGLPAATAAELTRARLSIFRPQTYATVDRGGNASGRVNLAWTPREDLLAYLSYADGFKSGGLNMSGLPLDAVNRPALATAVIDDERNRTIEAGFKRRVAGGRAALNVAAYRTTVTDYQANIVSRLETAALRSYPSNIPEVGVQGIEIDAALRFGARWSVAASVAYADGENTDYPEGPCPLERQTAATIPCNLSGVRLAGLSRWVGSISADYRRPLAGGELIVHFDANRRTGYYADTSASQFTWIDAHTLVNANVGYAWPNGWEFMAWGRNVFDARFLTALTIQAGNSGLIVGQAGDPRLFGGTLRFRF